MFCLEKVLKTYCVNISVPFSCKLTTISGCLRFYVELLKILMRKKEN